MIQITEKSKCSGCSACAQICPKGCIKMAEDSEGFLYPSVDKSVCVNCGKCEKVCPVITTKFYAKKGFPEGHLIYVDNKDDRVKSAAGGGFVGLAESFMKRFNGVVFGAVYDADYNVKHIAADNELDLARMQKSKYVQSNINNTFVEVKKYLLDGRYVLFSGTPCQIYGLKSFLGDRSDDEKLYCVDLSCHGVPSPKVFKLYLHALEEKEHSKIKSFTMRDKQIKKDAYNQGFGIEFENGVRRFYSHSEDMFGRCFWGEIASRPSCYDCHFKTVWRKADITLGDCWFFESFVHDEKDSLGVTMALAHTAKGEELIQASDNLTKYDVDAEKLIKANGGMIYSSAVMHAKRNEFFSELDRYPFEKIADSFVPKKNPSKKQRILMLSEKCGLRLEFMRRKSRMKKLNLRLNRVIPPEALGEMK